MNGIILVNKHSGVTSRDIVNDLTHIFNTKKIGHTGTLDPMAEGLLICTIGKYTKLEDDICSNYKEYIAEGILGYETDTLDITGEKIKESLNKVCVKDIEDAIKTFIGEYDQEVPLYSSVKIAGKKLYEYARGNIEVTLPKRKVDIKEIEILDIKEDYFKIRCVVSKGTYIRSLIRDIGSYLNTYATMSSLIRTKQGKFSLNDAYKIKDIKKGNYKLLDLEDILELDIINCDEGLYKLVNNGVKLDNKYNKYYILFKYNGNNIALYKKDDMLYRMYIKF